MSVSLVRMANHQTEKEPIYQNTRIYGPQDYLICRIILLHGHRSRLSYNIKSICGLFSTYRPKSQHGDNAGAISHERIDHLSPQLAPARKGLPLARVC